MQFLVDREILQAVRHLAARDGVLRAAVAFWGRGAGQQTGITERAQQSAQSTRILCDLLSGACNPHEIRHLKESGVEIKYRPNLHAKVWMHGNEIVVGSANASTNGLEFEAAGSNIEAAIHLNDKKVAKKVLAWFRREWDLAQRVDDALLQTAEALWNRSQNRRRTIERCLITAYIEDELTNVARDRFDKIAPDHYDDVDLDEIQVADDTCYEFGPSDVPPTEGTVYMDYIKGKNDSDFKFGGFWEVVHNERIHANAHTLCLLRKRPNRDFRSPQGCGGRAGIDKMINCHLQKESQSSLDLEFRVFYVLQQQRYCLNNEQRCNDCPL